MTQGRASTGFVWPCAILIGVAIAGWTALRPRAALELRAPRSGSSAPREVSGLEGRFDALALRVRLAPLHAEPARQAFETRALRQRFGRAEGEPFRLELALDEGARPVRAALGNCSVIDASGAVLAPLVHEGDVEALQGAPADPLRALLAAGPVELVPGRSTTLLLWGRMLGAGVRVRGLCAEELALDAASWSSDPLDDVLARLPAPRSEELGR